MLASTPLSAAKVALPGNRPHLVSARVAGEAPAPLPFPPATARLRWDTSACTGGSVAAGPSAPYRQPAAFPQKWHAQADWDTSPY
jgi:hypothetical protein